MAPAAVSGQACGGSGLAGRRLSPRGRARSPGVGELCAGHSAAGTGAVWLLLSLKHNTLSARLE